MKSYFTGLRFKLIFIKVIVIDIMHLRVGEGAVGVGVDFAT
jgi:hypothetical protein